MSIPRRITLVVCLLVSSAVSAQPLIDRWAKAAGGRDKVGAIRSLYREAKVEIGEYSGSIKVWHTADGKYRKEEQVATFSVVETFDGTNGTVQQGGAAVRPMSAAELAIARSKTFANANAMFFAFFPDRHAGRLVVEEDGTIVMTPEGGIDWKITLDPETSLPKTMAHVEGGQIITVTYPSYETIDGVRFEKEIHRAMGERKAVITFTKTVINPELDTKMFAPPLH